MKKLLIIIACACLVNGTALAFKSFDGGFGKLGARGKGSGGSGSACAGVIDASKGCPLPMLGS